MVRCKFVLMERRETHWNRDSRTLVFQPQYDQSIPEDQRLAKATPDGKFEMRVDNPAALAQFELGKTYYFDITPAE